jgi:hypothetical protein
MDNDKAGHYEQRYKDGHIGKTVQLLPPKRKID